ncbi:MAG: DUF3833 family protein [Bdellovibrionales bacterium]|nr:DUF3833 family protein [Bdellovibrionales bacterium]
MKTLLNSICLFAFCAACAGCSGMRVEDFSEATPRFVPEVAFDGQFRAHGLFYDRFGDVKRKFSMMLTGVPSTDGISLHEELRFDDGETLTRNYRFVRIDEHSYKVFCDDLVEPAEVRSYGNVLHWRYTLKQKIGDSVWNLRFSDWMFLQDDGTILNRAYVTKWGFDVGEIVLAAYPVDRGGTAPRGLNNSRGQSGLK